jgi:NAD+ synthase (glutamine-hydrolysing)
MKRAIMLRRLNWVRVAAAVPKTAVAAVQENIVEMLGLARQAAESQCDLLVFPELCLTSYTCGELFHQPTLLDAAKEGLGGYLKLTANLDLVTVVGLPLAVNDRLYNCAAAVQRGRILGVVPKTYIPGYMEYYESRWFSSGEQTAGMSIELCGNEVPFGTDLIFKGTGTRPLSFGIEICEDLWAPIPPSSRLALAGASIILNPSASNDLVGKADYRRELIRQQSGRCLAGYVYCAAGLGESSTDLVFGGHAMIAENAVLLKENQRFQRRPQLIVADLDTDHLETQRRQNRTFAEGKRLEHGDEVWRTIIFDPAEGAAKQVQRRVDPRPFVPSDAGSRTRRCREIFALQSSGLATRLAHINCRNVVIGLSGGLDSTLALLVIVDAFKQLELDLEGIHGITMPGYGTTGRTFNNTKELCAALRLKLETIDIRPCCEQHFKDLGHDGKTHDITYENVQARERTQVLMDKANMVGGLVIGTGDLSELALGWCTYNGDHMSMYGVNVGVPKTLVQFLIDTVAEDWGNERATKVLRDILATPISPELLPPDAEGNIAQKTEDVVGPYELHDFFLYQVVRCGFRPSKILLLAKLAFAESYTPEVIKKWLVNFYRRFFGQQFKRSCLPDGPKIGTVSLSPRGDWRMPSDARVDEWISELEEED